jgi:hypothetical protein
MWQLRRIGVLQTRLELAANAYILLRVIGVDGVVGAARVPDLCGLTGCAFWV